MKTFEDRSKEGRKSGKQEKDSAEQPFLSWILPGFLASCLRHPAFWNLLPRGDAL
jgi:hypothetical protein